MSDQLKVISDFIDSEIDTNDKELNDLYLKPKVLDYKIGKVIKRDVLEKIDEKFGDVIIEETKEEEETIPEIIEIESERDV